MQRHLLLFLLLFPLSLPSRSIDSIFIGIPSQVLPILERNARLDMLDYYNAGMRAVGENTLGGQSVMLKKTADFVQLESTPASTWELRILTSGRDTLFLCIHSIKATGISSRLTAYDSDWKPSGTNLPKVKFDDLFCSNDSLSTERCTKLRNILDGAPIKASWTENSTQLVFTLCTDRLSPADRPDAQRCLRQAVYEWKNGHFALVE